MLFLENFVNVESPYWNANPYFLKFLKFCYFTYHVFEAFYLLNPPTP